MSKSGEEASVARMVKLFLSGWITPEIMPPWVFSRTSFTITLTFENLETGERLTRTITSRPNPESAPSAKPSSPPVPKRSPRWRFVARYRQAWALRSWLGA